MVRRSIIVSLAMLGSDRAEAAGDPERPRDVFVSAWRWLNLPACGAVALAPTSIGASRRRCRFLRRHQIDEKSRVRT
jgi:hypothetical protein